MRSVIEQAFPYYKFEDVDLKGGDAEIEVIPMQNASAAEVVRVVGQLVQGAAAAEGGGAQGEQRPVALAEGLQDAQTAAQWPVQRLLLEGDLTESLREYPEIERFDADATFAQLFDEAGVDMLLVGDSLGMVVHGLPNTVGVTLEMMILHGQAVIDRKSVV